MLEKRIKEIDKNLSRERKEYFILTHKSHGREIYFQNNKKAIAFMKIKFNSPLKKIIHFLIVKCIVESGK